jgi:hypothetical protein
VFFGEGRGSGRVDTGRQGVAEWVSKSVPKTLVRSSSPVAAALADTSFRMKVCAIPTQAARAADTLLAERARS